MGFFERLFGKQESSSIEVAPDHIWITEDAKFNGIFRELAERSQSRSNAILLVAYFPDVLKRLEGLAANLNGKVPVRAVLASNLTVDLASGLDDSGVLDLIIGERHPMWSIDDHLEQFIRELPARCRVSYHLSTDDAVIRAFTGSHFKELLHSMGMKEDESIQSSLINRQIRKAQQKIDTKTFGDADADSAEEWLQKNCPTLTRSERCSTGES